MKIEILTVGDEVLAGEIIDTNSSYLGDKLLSRGLKVTYRSGVRDDPQTMKEAFLLAASRAQIVLVTGGLGSTSDDFTLEIASKVFKTKWAVDSAQLKLLSEKFEKAGRKLTFNDKKQVRLPQGGMAFENKVGLAPGVYFRFKKTHFYFMPGVPREMKSLFEQSVLPHLLTQIKKVPIFERRVLRTFGMRESEVNNALHPYYEKRLYIQGVRMGFRAHFPEVLVKLSASHSTRKGLREKMDRVEKIVLKQIGLAVYGREEDTLESVVGKLLIQHGKTVALAESCTGGYMAHLLTNVPGASAYVLGGVVSYSNQAKIDFLGVSPSLLKEKGAVSSEVACAMAQGIQKRTGSDFALAVTGIAGPTGGTPDKPVGTVHIALATPSQVTEKKFHFPFGRQAFKQIVAAAALNWLRRELGA